MLVHSGIGLLQLAFLICVIAIQSHGTWYSYSNLLRNTLDQTHTSHASAALWPSTKHTPKGRKDLPSCFHIYVLIPTYSNNRTRRRSCKLNGSFMAGAIERLIKVLRALTHHRPLNAQFTTAPPYTVYISLPEIFPKIILKCTTHQKHDLGSKNTKKSL